MEALAAHALFGYTVHDPMLKESISTVHELLESASHEVDIVEILSDALDDVEETIKAAPSSLNEYGYLLASVANLRDEVEFSIGAAEPVKAKADMATYEFSQAIQWRTDLPVTDGYTALSTLPAASPPSAPSEVRCDVCAGDVSFADDRIVICDECDVAVHESCYDIKRVPDSAWYCHFCASNRISCESDLAACAACNHLGGALVPTLNGKWVHMACTLYLPELYFIHDKVEGIELLKPRRKLKCSLCRKADNAACVQCCAGKCPTAYHVMCALRSGVTFTRHEDTYVSYCKVHAEATHSGGNLPVVRHDARPSTKRSGALTARLLALPPSPPLQAAKPPTSTPAKPPTPSKPPMTTPVKPSKPPMTTPAKASSKLLTPSKPTPVKPSTIEMTPTKAPRSIAMKAPRPEYFQTKLTASVAKPKARKNKELQEQIKAVGANLFDCPVFVPIVRSNGEYIMCLVPALPLGIEFDPTALLQQKKYIVEYPSDPSPHGVFTYAYAHGYLAPGDELCAINSMPLANISPTHMKDEILPQCKLPIQCWFKKKVPLPTDGSRAVEPSGVDAPTSNEEWPWCYLRSDGKLAMPRIWSVFDEMYHGTSVDTSALLESLRSPESLYVIPPIGFSDIPDVVYAKRKELRAAQAAIPVAALPPLDVGTMVKVAKRTWPGINKLGGTGRVKARRPVGDGFTYDVVYVLGGRENQIERQYVTPVTMDDPVGATPSDANDATYDEAWTLQATLVAMVPMAGMEPCATSFQVTFRVECETDAIVETSKATMEALPEGVSLRLNAVTDVLEDGVPDEIGPQLQALHEQLRTVDASTKATFEKLSLLLEKEKKRAYFAAMEALTNRQYEEMYAKMMALHEEHYGPVNPPPTPKTAKTVALVPSSGQVPVPTLDLTSANEDKNDDDDEDDVDLPLFITDKQEESSATCVLCLIPGGDLAATSCGQVAHIMCLLYTPETYFDEHLGYGIANVPAERQSLVCVICRKKVGVNKLQCASKKCTKSYHVQCAYVHGLLTTYPSFAGWCPKHLAKADPQTQASIDWPPHIKKQLIKEGKLLEDNDESLLLPPLPDASAIPPHKRTTPLKQQQQKKPARKRKSDVLPSPKPSPPASDNEAPPASDRETPPSVAVFSVGDTVRVTERTWKGINKPGGVARIKKKHAISADAVTYDVEYILGGAEKAVEAMYIAPHVADVSGKKRRRTINATYEFD
ncbi:hypothetical protein SDRG_11408 [Saprolegnia diclina VS20]|uniref:PHD-type domain-containing protein n=1 Tax=Saprolegnia diclina (strain VS20) TaxID=1156394 RepID=T0QBM7_SAPDV|nr:hypothetical protein SDRG_11408 [Saprolegnia diclina VS20]EQC30930.1 hypothetical protein SDRG_11408 [Saprolegnia diclina VS20]|eukprot:XP_008615668.1 hypothetical protein SDRG_11408 [Saprolegnia diclina VS20]